jgi:hypothetical protein
VDEARKFAAVEEVKARLEAEAADMVAIDGVRVTTPDGWWLLRASHTQAVLVARAKARPRKAWRGCSTRSTANWRSQGWRAGTRWRTETYVIGWMASCHPRRSPGHDGAMATGTTA